MSDVTVSAFSPTRFNRYADDLSRAVYNLSNETRIFRITPEMAVFGPQTKPPPNPFRPETMGPSVSAIDRLKAKALEARNVAPDAIKKFEADLDSIIAQKAEIEGKRVAAVAPHQEAIAGVKGELDGLKSAMDILSNG